MNRNAINEVGSMDKDDAMSQPEVHKWFDSVERSLSMLAESVDVMHDRLYHVLENHPANEGEAKLRPSYSTPMVERLSMIVQRIDGLNEATRDVIRRIQI